MAPAPEITLRQVAHELNSLLDGSIRCIGLARSSLQTGQADSANLDIDDGLGKAVAAMKHMGALLQRALRLTNGHVVASPVALFHSGQTVALTLEEIMQIVRPIAGECDVALSPSVAPECRNLPAGPLGVVLLNTLRNAIESCAAGSGASKREVRIEIAIADDGRTLRIEVCDNGGGGQQDAREPDRPSHGVGLALSQQIVRELGGELALVVNDGGPGARLCVSLPLRSLTDHA